MTEPSHIIVPNAELMRHISQMLNNGLEVIIAAKGSSMLPAIREGRDSMAIRKVSAKEIRRGDILMAAVGNGFVIHRAKKIAGGEIVLQGDNNMYAVERVALSDILGRVEALVRGDKRINCRASLKRSMQVVAINFRRNLSRIKSR